MTEADNIKKVEKICNDTNDMMDRILRTFAQVKQPEEPSAAAPAGTPQQAGVKIKDGLKPEKLKMDNNPSDSADGRSNSTPSSPHPTS